MARKVEVKKIELKGVVDVKRVVEDQKMVERLSGVIEAGRKTSRYPEGTARFY